MSDTTYNVFQHYGTNAERLAFTPDPAPAIQPIYIWYETDTGNTYLYYTDWVAIAGSGIIVPPPPDTPVSSSTFLVSGGQVTWVSAYTFRISAAEYYINEVFYTSAEDTVTLSAAHATLDRIDVIAVDTTGSVVVIEGTASATPSEPTVDPSTHLKLGIVLVVHATSAPPTASSFIVYAENAGSPTEWTWGVGGASFDVNSTASPQTGSKNIEATNLVAGVNADGTTTPSIEINDYDTVRFFMKSKATWANNRGILVKLLQGVAPVGAAIQIRRSGTYGFDSSNTTDYQQVAIPISNFAVPLGTPISGLRFEGYGGAIGFYIDNVNILVNAVTVPGTYITQDQADARYAPLVHATRHGAAGADPITISQAQVTGLVSDLANKAGVGDPPINHASRHYASGGVDPLDVKQLDGFPGGTTLYLRADQTFGTPPGTGAAQVKLINFVIGDGTNVITTGAKAPIRVNFAGTITKWTILSIDDAITSGSIVLDIWKDTLANYPPTVADTITASAKPTVSGATNAESSTLTGWTTSVSVGDIFRPNVDSISSFTKIIIQLEVSL